MSSRRGTQTSVSQSARVRKVFHATPSGRPLSPMRVMVALLRAGFWGSAKNASGPGSLIPGKLVSPRVRTVVEVAEAVRAGELKASEILDICLDAVGTRNDELNAFVHLDADAARKTDEAVDDAVARGDDPGPLAGVPFGVKDLEHCARMPTSHGSLLYKGRPPVAGDSVHVTRLR